jgi:hypothetical protein
MQQTADSFSTPPHYDDTRDHQAAFFQSVRTRQKPVEDVVFGNNAAISCHMANYSYFKNGPAVWDAQARRIRA